ncbi:hypothetical protein GQ44DRAFT_705992 [Phaeosphaeriaceae sp. PMI808]|nr:hypothetical protein GQ44DRAFT_705992 [Phaeosphaeriaceae sp. PMI808]
MSLTGRPTLDRDDSSGKWRSVETAQVCAGSTCLSRWSFQTIRLFKKCLRSALVHQYST